MNKNIFLITFYCIILSASQGSWWQRIPGFRPQAQPLSATQMLAKNLQELNFNYFVPKIQAPQPNTIWTNHLFLGLSTHAYGDSPETITVDNDTSLKFIFKDNGDIIISLEQKGKRSLSATYYAMNNRWFLGH